jgi:hypothetical protein
MLKSDLIRSPGVHASDIYGALHKELDPKRYDYGDAPPNPLLLAIGSAWEKHLEFLMAKNGVMVERPTEFMSPEGIAFSPDLIFFNGVTRLGEIKLTSMSAKDMPVEETNSLPPKMDKYLTQMMLYAYWLGLTDGWLGVLFLNKPWNPEFREFNITWTQRELDDNHSMCMQFARHKGLL